MPPPLLRVFYFSLATSACFAAACLRAEYVAPSEYTLREWHASDGLPSDEVGSLMQDNSGYLWVGTTSGLVRFDGTTFDAEKTPPEISARGMIYCRAGVGHDHADIVAPGNVETNADGNGPGSTDGYYVRAGGVFHFVREPKLTGKIVRVVFIEENSTLWLGCEDGTLFRRQGEETKIFDAPIGSIGKKTPIFATDGNKQLWVSINNFVAHFDGSRWIPIPIEPEEIDVRIASSRTGGPWLFTRTALLKWTGEKLEEITKLPELLGAHFIQATMEDQHGSLWIGTRSQGLFRITQQELLHAPTSQDEIYTLCEDSTGGIWVGTNGGGLDRLRPKTHRLYDKISGLKDSFSYTVSEDMDGVIWLANRDGGVARIRDGEVDTISRRVGWRPFSAMSIFAAPSGGVWITSGIGVFRTDVGQPEKVQRIQSLNNFKIVRATYVARNGDYWLSLDQGRVARWRNDHVIVLGPSEDFEAREVRGFAEDASGTMWVGAADGRLFHSVGDRLERVPLPEPEKYGSLQALHFESDGTLLIGTTRQGVLMLSAKDREHPRVLSSEQGLPYDNVTQILADDFDRIWFASRGGIFWIHRAQISEFLERKTEHVHAVMLGKDDDIPELSCLGLFQPSAWKGRDGKLWFATRRGMLRIDPLLTSSDNSLPPVTISSVKCDGRNQPTIDQLEIRSNVRKTEIRFSALSLSAPERILVRYRLDGFDNDWVLQAPSRIATYPRLPPGNYIFRVAASNGSGIWSDQEAFLKIAVFPPWWQSTWADLFYLFALILAVTILVRAWSHRRLRLRLERLEREQAIERERTRIAQNIHDDLGASLTRISLLTQSTTHDDPAHAKKLDQIFTTAHDITRSMDEIVWAVNPKCDDMESLVYYVGNFAQNFLGTSGVRCRLDLPADLPSIQLSSQLRHNLFLCCKEALNNVVKHAQANEVVVTIAVSESLLQIRIADNGRGMLQSAAAPSVDPNRISTGNGMKNMQSRMAEMNGNCTISARHEGGTMLTFSVALPLVP